MAEEMVRPVSWPLLHDDNNNNNVVYNKRKRKKMQKCYGLCSFDKVMHIDGHARAYSSDCFLNRFFFSFGKQSAT